MLTVKHCVLISFFVASVYGYSLNCDKGPTYWCLTAETAEECGVSEFCEIMEVEGLNKMEHEHHKKLVPASAAPPVNVSLYYESLCPGCRAMIKTQIYPTYQALKSTGIVNINLYPYGNAREHKKGQIWVFECQHGEDECQVNLVETCALHLLPPIYKMPFIHCVETSPSPTIDSGKNCAIQLGLEWDPIFSCYNGSVGNFLEHQMAEKTDALKPSHWYVPWVTVNGVHTEKIQDKVSDDMLGYVCSVYQGPKPDACSTQTATHPVKRRIEACYKEHK